jgi:uncharacterized BrkB/YihY/UPF0761 family membrane protein
MNLWGLIETVLDIISYLCNWRFSVCLFIGIALAFFVAGNIAVEPLRWIVAGAIVVASMVIGWHWDSSN